MTQTITLFAVLGSAAAHFYYVEPHHNHHHHEPSAPAHYEFAYAVHDPHTGDIKSQHEQRDGDAVSGHYDLIDSDGFKRIVEYTADAHSGFQATVQRVPTDIRVPQPHQHQSHYYNHHQQPAHQHQASITHHSAAAAAAHQQHSHAMPFNWHAARPYSQVASHIMRSQKPAYVSPLHDQHAVASAPMGHEAAHVRVNVPGITNYHY